MSRCSLCLLALALFAGAFAIGCGKKARPEVEVAEEEKPAPAAAVHVDPEPGKAAVTKSEPAPVPRDRLHQSFADATLDSNNPPTDMKPIDRTLTGKSGPDLLAKVQRAWDGVRFTTPAGQKIDYTAEIHTNRGVLAIALLPEISPNHVRNFLVLARLGYYDGLRFDRVRNEKGESGELSCVEAGCPMGTGEEGTGSLGYWVKDELTKAEQMSHSPGVVGACRVAEKDTAATKFYVNLTESRSNDGNFSLFAVVTKGLDVARTIAQQPLSEDENGSQTRPKTPVIIHKVTIHESAKPAGEK